MAADVLANLVLTLMLLQTPVRRLPRQPVNPQGANVDAIATFKGTFKAADKKFITVEVEEGQTMRMYVTGSTKIVRDGKPAKLSQFHSGDNVTVDASRDARMNLLAVRIESAKQPDR